MLRKERILLWLLPLLAGGLVFGVAHLFRLRFESGDIYPPYSSFRTDPLGTKALYESLRKVRGLTAQRFTRPLQRLPEGRGRTLFFLGVDADEMSQLSEDEFKPLERFLKDGGRMVFSFVPVNTKPWSVRFEEGQTAKKKKESAGKDEGRSGRKKEEESRPKRRRFSEEDGEGLKLISLKDRWGVEFDYENLPQDEEGAYRSVNARRTEGATLPASILWHTALYFNKLGSDWHAVYARDQHPVIIERRFGRGSIVLSADSYFVSNEAMREERHATLLAWLVGPGSGVLFDEMHLGVVEEPGVAALLRKYRLHGLVLGVLLLAGLFVWKNALSFVPAYDEAVTERRGDLVSGRDSAAGFVNLLRRGIAPSEVLAVCFAEWAKSCAHGRAQLTAKAERMAAVVAGEQARAVRERHPVEAYQEISRLLAQRGGVATGTDGGRSPSAALRDPMRGS